MLTKIGLALMWLLHFLPLPLLALLGQMLGMLLYFFGRERRRVARINLGLCFPAMNAREKESLVKAHFRSLGRSFLEHCLLWWSSKNRIRRLVRIEGIENWEAVSDRPVIWLAPHFVGLDMGGVRLSCDYPAVSVYSHQKNAKFDEMLLHGRRRFGTSTLLSRQEGLRPVIRAMKKKLPFYYLPDMDFGIRDSSFVPFFGVQTATVTGLARLAAMTGAAVVPCVTKQLPRGQGYVLKFHPAWQGYPTEDIEADTRRMNAFIEDRILEMPEQYYWLHKRFKTRPEGEESFYA